MARGLAAVHRVGAVHRDVKPEVLITPSQQVKLFDLDGQPLGAIGKAGPLSVGKYDPGHMNRPGGCWLVSPENAGQSAFAGAPAGQPVLWVAEADEHPKRLSVWTLDGRLLKAFYGPPGYGGGGFLDAADKTRFFYNGMEFRLDWEHGESRLVNVYSRGALPLPGSVPETPIVLGGRRYLVNTFTPGDVQSGPGFVSVYLYSEQGELRPAAVVGSLGSMRDWPPLKTPALEAICKGQSLFAWSDLADNETGYEVERKVSGAPAFARAATLPAGSTGYVDTGLDPRTTYVYRIRAAGEFGSSAYSAEVSATTPHIPGVPGGREPTSSIIKNENGFR